MYTYYNMNLEIEAKFTRVDHDEVRNRLKNVGATCERPMTLMRRVVYHPLDDRLDAFFRVRDEGDKVTMDLQTIRRRQFYPWGKRSRDRG